MGIQKFMASQLRQPSGWFGSLVMSRLLNKVNGQIVSATLALLDVKPEHHVLEIGFGGGSALSRLVKGASSGVITGVDISPEMVRRAERRFRRDIQAGRLRVQVGDATHLPFGASVFDRVFTINTIYFWPNTLEGLGEIYRVLQHDGMAAISIRSKDKMEKQAVVVRPGDCCRVPLMDPSGLRLWVFPSTRTERLPGEISPFHQQLGH